MGIFNSVIQSMKSQNAVGWVVIGTIIILLVTGLVLAIRMKSYYDKLLKDLQNKEDSRDFTNKEISTIVEKYKDSASKGTENINTEALIERNLKSFVMFGEKWTTILPSFFIALGLLGTFLGLTLAIFETRTALDSIDNINNFSTALQGPISSMSNAFWTSIFGVISSLILNAINVRTRNVKESFYNYLEDYLDNEVFAEYAYTFNNVFQEFNNTIKTTMLNLTEEMKDLFKYGVEELVNKINANSIDLTESAKALQNYTVEFEKLVGSLDRTIDKFEAPMDSFRTSIESFQVISGDLSDTISTSIGEFTSKIDGDFTNKIESIGENFTNNVATLEENFTTRVEILGEGLTGRIEQLGKNFINNISDIEDNFTTRVEKLGENFTSNIITLEEDFTKRAEKLGESLNSNMNSLDERFNTLYESIGANKEAIEKLGGTIIEETEVLRICYSEFEQGLQDARWLSEMQNKEFLDQIAMVNRGYEKFGEGFESFKKSLESMEVSIAKGFAGVVQGELNMLSREFVDELDFAIRGIREATEDLSGSVNIVGQIVRATNEWVAVTTFNNKNVEEVVKYED